MTRTRIATALLGLVGLVHLGGAALRLADGAPLAAPLPLALAAVHGVLAWAVARRGPWARWVAMGVAFYGTLGAIALAPSLGAPGCAAGRWLMVGLHAPLPLLLARPDPLHARTSLSLLLAGAALVPTLTLGLQTLAFGVLFVLPAAAALLATAGTYGVARGRTWGLLGLGAAGLTLLGPAIGAGASGCAFAATLGATTALASVLLLAAVAPFVGPMTRFLTGR